MCGGLELIKSGEGSFKLGKHYAMARFGKQWSVLEKYYNRKWYSKVARMTIVRDDTTWSVTYITLDIFILEMTCTFWRQNTFTFNKPAPLGAKILRALHWKCSSPFYS